VLCSTRAGVALSSGRERRRREGHEVNESVADIADDGDCDAGRKTAGDCSEQMQISNLTKSDPHT